MATKNPHYTPEQNAILRFIELCQSRNVAMGLLFRTSTAAKLLDMSPEVLYQMRVQNTGPKFTPLPPTPKGRIYYSLFNLVEWIQQLPQYSSKQEMDADFLPSTEEAA